jgi:hypothetical protein
MADLCILDYGMNGNNEALGRPQGTECQLLANAPLLGERSLTVCDLEAAAVPAQEMLAPLRLVSQGRIGMGSLPHDGVDDAAVAIGGSLGTEITLDVAGVSVTYSKNHRGIDHGSIFQEKDRKPIKSDQLDYDWYEEEGEDPRPSEMAFTRPLKRVVPRLELLGFDLERVRREYDAVAQNWREERQSPQDDDEEPIPDLMNFAEFRAFATKHPIDSLDDTFISGTDDASEAKMRGRFEGVQFERIPAYRSS